MIPDRGGAGPGGVSRWATQEQMRGHRVGPEFQAPVMRDGSIVPGVALGMSPSAAAAAALARGMGNDGRPGWVQAPASMQPPGLGGVGPGGRGPGDGLRGPRGSVPVPATRPTAPGKGQRMGHLETEAARTIAALAGVVGGSGHGEAAGSTAAGSSSSKKKKSKGDDKAEKSRKGGKEELGGRAADARKVDSRAGKSGKGNSKVAKADGEGKARKGEKASKAGGKPEKASKGEKGSKGEKVSSKSGKVAKGDKSSRAEKAETVAREDAEEGSSQAGAQSGSQGVVQITANPVLKKNLKKKVADKTKPRKKAEGHFDGATDTTTQAVAEDQGAESFVEKAGRMLGLNVVEGAQGALEAAGAKRKAKGEVPVRRHKKKGKVRARAPPNGLALVASELTGWGFGRFCRDGDDSRARSAASAWCVVFVRTVWRLSSCLRTYECEGKGWNTPSLP